ncbi:MAG: trehalose-phosphatase [Bacteroidales bacterium]|nr:MAG: trehalose-phosphatase [Bacteroidales bacterium]
MNSIKAELIKKYKKATNKLILLDYDGTLVDYSSIPDNAKPPKNLLKILNKLVNKPETKVIIISGRGYQDIDKFLGHLPIDIIAEHGAMVKNNGEWKKQANNSEIWKKKVLPILNQVTLVCPNSIIEEKLFSLSWHYRNAETGYNHSRKLIGLLDNIIHTYKLKVLDGNQVVEIMSEEIGKGKAVKNLLEHNRYDYILSIGDDKTDEEMFEFLMDNPNANTIKVGNGETYAKYKFDNVDKIVELLKQLSL